MINEFVLGIAIILLTGLLFGKLARKLNIPNITGYLVGGLIVGPALGFFIKKYSGIIGWDMLELLELIVDIELGFIAFTVGCEFKVSFFKEVGPMPVIVAFSESFGAVLFVTVGVTAIGMLIGMPFYFAVCLGAISGATAPAATMMVLKQYRAKGPFTRTLLSVVAVDDTSGFIFFGIAMAIVKNLVGSGGGSVLSLIWPVIEIIGSCAMGVIVGLFLTYVIKFFKSKSNRLVLAIATIFLNIGICILIEHKTGYTFSSLLACMATGAIFTNMSKKVDEVVPLVENIMPPLVIIFFVVSGANLKFGSISWQAIVILLVYIVMRVGGKILGSRLSAKACKVPLQIRSKLGLGLLPQGGIDIGLSMIIMKILDENLAGGKYAGTIYNGEMLRVIVLLAVLISGVFGPILCKYALVKAGEVHNLAYAMGKKRAHKYVLATGAAGAEDLDGVADAVVDEADLCLVAEDEAAATIAHCDADDDDAPDED